MSLSEAISANKSQEIQSQVLKSGTEDERKFLVTEIPANLKRYICHEIEQGYLAIDPRGSEVRIRKCDQDYFETVKTGKGGERPETERTISAADYADLSKHILGNLIEKTRYVIPYGDYTIELDIFEGQLAGLVMAEVEFPDKASKDKFDPPSWFGTEITDVKEFKNANLSRDGLPHDFEGLVINPPISSIPHFEVEEGLQVSIAQIEKLVNAATQPVIVGVAGGSASGKTSAIAEGLRAHFKEDALIISMDDYMRGDTFLNKMLQCGIEINWDHPLYTDFERLIGDLKALKLSKGEEIELPVYSFISAEADQTRMVKPTKLIIVEGLFALRSEVNDSLDLGIFVDIGPHGQLIRRLMRDIDRTPMSPDAIVSYFLSTVGPMQQRFVNPQAWNADVVIDSEYKPQLEAQNSGLLQKQFKFKIDLPDRRLLELRAENLGESHQVDYYYQPTDRDFGQTGELIRVRNEGKNWILTYKGPISGDSSYTRSKFEVPLKERTAHALTDLYRGNGFIIEKDRTNYHIANGCVLSIDKNVTLEDRNGRQNLGNWIEIRVPSGIEQAAVDQLLEKLELSKLQNAESYASLVTATA